MIDLERILEAVDTKYALPYQQSVSDMLVAKATGDRVALSAARDRLSKIIATTMAVSEILGAQAMLRQASQAYADEYGAKLRADQSRCLRFASEPATLANVTFEEAVADMLSRTPVTLRNAAERTAQKVAELYEQGRVVAFVRAAEQAVTVKAQSMIEQAVREGVTEAQAGTLISQGVEEVRKKGESWTAAYSKMVFRTNLNTAVTAGRFRQAQDPDVRAVVPAFRFDAVGDPDTRHNHMAMDGRVMKVDNPAWAKVAPPLGYNCRCQITLLSLPILRRMGRLGKNGQVIEDSIPPGAGPDPGFRHQGRPDLAMVRA